MFRVPHDDFSTDTREILSGLAHCAAEQSGARPRGLRFAFRTATAAARGMCLDLLVGRPVCNCRNPHNSSQLPAVPGSSAGPRAASSARCALSDDVEPARAAARGRYALRTVRPPADWSAAVRGCGPPLIEIVAPTRDRDRCPPRLGASMVNVPSQARILFLCLLEGDLWEFPRGLGGSMLAVEQH